MADSREGWIRANGAPRAAVRPRTGTSGLAAARPRVARWAGALCALALVGGSPAAGLACAPAPVAGCATSRVAKLTLRDASGTEGDRLIWQWRKGDVTELASFGDPLSATAYSLCVYDHAAGSSTLTAAFEVPAGGGWIDRGDGGFRYKDSSATFDGVRKLRLVPGSRGDAKISFTAKGGAISLPGPAATDRYFLQDGAVTVQLQSSDGPCWTSSFAEAHTRKTSPDRFRAKIDGKQPHVYVVLHIDPNRTTDENFARLTNFFEMLEERRARGFDHRVTLFFTPEWSPFILDGPPTRLATAAVWKQRGHEFGLHRHTPAHQNPDGFAEDPAYRCEPRCCKYFGPACSEAVCSSDAAVSVVRDLVEDPAIGGTLRSGNVGPQEGDLNANSGGVVDGCFGIATGLTFYEEVPPDLDFTTVAYPAHDAVAGWWEDGAGNNDPQKLLGRVGCFTPADHPNVPSTGVKTIPHAQYYNEQNRDDELPLDAIEDALDVAGKKDYIGVVWHEDGYPSSSPSCSTADGDFSRQAVCGLFDALEARGLTSRTVSEVLVEPGCS